MVLKLTAGNLDTGPQIVHTFFGRKGGVSAGIYSSLNCGPGSGDIRADVVENRRRALTSLAPESTSLLTLYQMHGAETVQVSKPWELGQGPRADAMVTSCAGLALGILTADCAPVLFADRDAGVVGAAHAGWKGAVAGVVESVLSSMERLGARREQIAAAIGPCISQVAYEVGDDLRALMADDSATQFFVPSGRPGHWQFDLPRYVRSRLERAGVANVCDLDLCTYGHEAAFFSYRRATHRGEGDYGRQLSAIMLV